MCGIVYFQCRYVSGYMTYTFVGVLCFDGMYDWNALQSIFIACPVLLSVWSTLRPFIMSPS